MKSLVSVILAVYNGEKYLAETIESVLSQTYSPIEFIIINDGSEDSTASIIKQYSGKIRYHHQANQGQPAAMNKGISMATGSYLAFIDADDLYTPDKIALHVACLEENQSVDMVFGYAEHFFTPELNAEIRKKLICPTNVMRGYLASGGLFRRSTFDRVGEFAVGQCIGAFIDWYMRSNELGLKNMFTPHKVLMRRIHDSNCGLFSRYSSEAYLNTIKIALKRRQLHEA